MPEGISKEILKVDEEIKNVKSDIEKCEDEIKIAISNALQSTGIDKKFWVKEVQALRAEMDALRAEKKSVNEASLQKLLIKEVQALRAKENALMYSEGKCIPFLLASIFDCYLISAHNFPDAEKTLSALQQAKMSCDRFLEFPFEVKEFRESDRMLQSVYVRSSYIDIFSLICNSIISGTMRIVVTGTPGIGKSTFLYYFIWKFLNDEKGSLNQNRFNLYIQCTPFTVLQFINDRVIELNGIDATKTLKRDNKALVLVDMVESVEPMGCTGIRIVLSSPNPARFKEFSKSRCLSLYMNSWLYSEILTVWEKSYKGILSLEEVD